MRIEDQLREYRGTLDAATDDAAARADRAAAPVIRMHPVRSLAVAAIAVAAAIAIAFAVVGSTNKRSTPPAGITTTAPTTIGPPSATTLPDVVGMHSAQATTTLTEFGFIVKTTVASKCVAAADTVVTEDPAPGTHVEAGSAVTIGVCPGEPTRPATKTLPVTVCPTEQGSIDPADPHAPATVSISSPSFNDPAIGAYSGKRGFLIVTAPAGWNCKAIEAGDGGQGVGVTPPGSTPRDGWGQPGHPITPLTDGVFASAVNACQGCVYSEICEIVPTAAADFANNGIPCSRPPGETVVDRGNGVYEYDDPAGAIGPDVAHSILRYVRATAHTDASVVRETCVLPASQRAVCDTLLAEFLALQPTPWTQPALTISPTALGAVTLGSNLFVAQESAGQTFDRSGDGFRYSRQQADTGLHLFVGVDGSEHVTCVGAELVISPHAPAQTVTTPEGFTLGDTEQQLIATYHAQATYVPAPKTGMTTHAGYVVQEPGGALAFSVNPETHVVYEIAGGASGITPNTCTG